MWTLLLIACTCTAPQPPQAEHYRTGAAMAGALRDGDLGALQEAARDLEDNSGRSPEEHPAVDTLRGGVGMALVAEDLEEGGWAVAAVARGCRSCHQGAGSGRQWAISDHGAAGAVLWPAYVRNDNSRLSEAAARLGAEVPELEEASGRLLSEDLVVSSEALGELLASCSGCHGPEGPRELR